MMMRGIWPKTPVDGRIFRRGVGTFCCVKAYELKIRVVPRNFRPGVLLFLFYPRKEEMI